MKKTSLIIFLLTFFYAYSFGQDTITVSGNLTDENGKPLQNVRVYFYKYDANGRHQFKDQYTDKNGYYSVKVKKGTTITYYYNSYYTYYQFVANELIINYTQIPKKSTNTKNYTPKKEGIAKMREANYNVMNGNGYYNYSYYHLGIYGLPVGSKRISNNRNYNLQNIDKIIFDKSTQTYTVDINNYNYRRNKPFTLEYISSVSFDSPNKLPGLQNKFSQGSIYSLGDDSKFSYGEKFENLNITPINPYDFFRTGIDVQNSINAYYKKKQTTYTFSYKNNTLSSIVPLSGKTTNIAMLNIENIKIKNSRLSIDGHFLDMKIAYPESAANYARLMHSITRTPQNFDNNNPEHQSYNGEAINPYFLINN